MVQLGTTENNDKSAPDCGAISLDEPKASPEELAVRCQKGSIEAFEALVEMYQGRLFQYLWQMTGQAQDAEDLTQEAFVKAFRAIDRYDPAQSFSTWLYTIAKRSALNHFRAARRGEELDLAENEAGPDDPAGLLARKDRTRSIWDAARRLKPKIFEALWLRYGEDFSVEETARIMGTSQIHVKVLIHRGRRQLARLRETLKIDF